MRKTWVLWTVVAALGSQVPLAAEVTEIPVTVGLDYRVTGMDYEDGYFWVAVTNFGFDGSPHLIRKIDASTGVEVSAIVSAVTTRTNGRDVVLVGDYIYQPEDLNGSHHVHKMLKADGSPVAEFSHSGTYPTGIAADDSHLYVVDTEGRWIQKRRLSDHAVVAQFPLSSSYNYNGATFLDDHLWVKRHPKPAAPHHDIIRIDPQTGSIVEALSLPSFVVPYAYDLAFDGTHFWFLIQTENKIVRAPDCWGLGDSDGDGIPDLCDLCPVDPENDSDGDGVCNSDDLCLGDDATGDEDGDGICDDTDPCFGSPNEDTDEDGVCDGEDACAGDDASGDSDGDGVCNDEDLCFGDDTTGDDDTDGSCNDIDVCPLDPENDADADGFCESDDNCPLVMNSDQHDNDEDGAGDACDDDDDNDEILDGDDNCPLDYNPGQEDFDEDGAGDFCDTDDDGDGVQDDGDECTMTAPGAVVAGNGCSIDQLCPCDNNWKNHGAYVRCVAHTSVVFVDLGLITEEEKDVIVSGAAASACGHKM